MGRTTIKRTIHARRSGFQDCITEFVENDRVRMVADSHGTIWDAVKAYCES